MAVRQDIISVITVVYNGVSFIEDTIKSVLSQTYNHMEYIVIDGGSTDGTTQIIEKYANRLSYWVSEPDKGIYDAMNKGIKLAKGKWINFMNAGDYFYNSSAVEHFFTTETELDSHAIVYGDAEFRLTNIAYIVRSGEQASKQHFMPFSHQASFIKTDVAQQYLFDTSYPITADTALSLRLLVDGHTFQRVPIIVCSYDASVGMSVENAIKCAKEIVRMQVEIGKSNADAPEFKRYIQKAKIRQYLRVLIPEVIWNKVRENRIKKKREYRLMDEQ